MYTIKIPLKIPENQGINIDIVYPLKFVVRLFWGLAVKTTWLAEKYEAFLKNRPFSPLGFLFLFKLKMYGAQFFLGLGKKITMGVRNMDHPSEFWEIFPKHLFRGWKCNDTLNFMRIQLKANLCPSLGMVRPQHRKEGPRMVTPVK